MCSQAELEKSQEGVQNVAIASFTLNKALQHVVPPAPHQKYYRAQKGNARIRSAFSGCSSNPAPWSTFLVKALP